MRYFLVVLLLCLAGAIVNNLRLENFERLDWFSSPEILPKPEAL